MRDAKSADNAPLYEVLHIFDRDGCKGFDLNPLGEVVDSHQEELGLPFPWRKWADNVHPPNGERPWEGNVVQLFRPCVVERAELLALGIFLHVFNTVALDGRPVVAGPQDLSDHRPRPRVIYTDSLVDLDQNVLGPFIGDAFQQGGRVSSSVQVFVNHDVPGALLLHRLSCSGLHVPSLRYWMTGVIQLSVSASASVTLGCLIHICMTDL